MVRNCDWAISLLEAPWAAISAIRRSLGVSASRRARSPRSTWTPLAASSLRACSAMPRAWHGVRVRAAHAAVRATRAARRVGVSAPRSTSARASSSRVGAWLSRRRPLGGRVVAAQPAVYPERRAGRRLRRIGGRSRRRRATRDAPRRRGPAHAALRPCAVGWSGRARSGPRAAPSRRVTSPKFVECGGCSPLVNRRRPRACSSCVSGRCGGTVCPSPRRFPRGGGVVGTTLVDERLDQYRGGDQRPPFAQELSGLERRARQGLGFLEVAAKQGDPCAPGHGHVVVAECSALARALDRAERKSRGRVVAAHDRERDDHGDEPAGVGHGLEVRRAFSQRRDLAGVRAGLQSRTGQVGEQPALVRQWRRRSERAPRPRQRPRGSARCRPMPRPGERS